MIRRTRVHVDDHYTIVPNAWLRDQRLSRRARGLLAELMSHRIGWEVTLDSLINTGPEGRDALRSAIDELVTCGYLLVQRERDDAGRLQGTSYTITDPAQTPSSEPKSDFPTLAEPTEAEPPHKKTIPSEDQRTSCSADAEQAFEEFWKAYPRKVGKLKARKAYAQALKQATSAEILAALSVTVWDDNPKYRPHPTSWLNAGRWMDETPPAAFSVNGTKLPAGPKLPAGWS